MIDPVTRATPPTPAAPRTLAEPQPPAPPADTAASKPAPGAAAAPPDRSPLSLEVAKADDGVFVYTLSDPNTGAVLAVIPRHSVEEQGGRTLDTRA